MGKGKTPGGSIKKTLERLRSNEPASSLATDLGVRETDVQLARELVRHVGEHQAAAAGRIPDALAQAVVEAAVQIEHAGFLKAVAEGGNKAAASAAKRGLAILRSRGIEVEFSPSGEAVFRKDSGPEEDPPCFITTQDSSGERALWIPRNLHGGGLQLITVLISDLTGVVHVEADEASRKSFRKLREDLADHSTPHGISLVEIDLKRAKGYLAVARALTRKGLKVEYDAFLASLMGDPRDAEPSTKSEPAAEPALESRWLSESGLIHLEREVKSWIPEAALVRSLGLRLDEIATSKLYVDEQQRRAQEEVEVLKAVGVFFAPERAKLYSDRLFELVEAFRANGKTDAASRAAAAARALRDGVDPTTIPFCKRLFEKLLVAPEPAPADAIPASPQSGLIVPGAPA